MKKIDRKKLIEDVKNACQEANIYLEEDVKKQIVKSKNIETNERSLSVYEQMFKNMEIAEKKKIPLCQDTGIVVCFIKLGNKVQIDFNLYEALNEGIRQGYDEGYLRKSVVQDPLQRINTKDNTPGVFHVELVEGDKFEIILAPKGAGSENMSSIRMFAPTTSKEEVIEYIVEVVKNANAKPCPPIILGIGIGGTFEKAALMSKEALLDKIGNYNSTLYYEEMEKEIINKVNELDIGAMGLKGDVTCLDASIKTYPSHIASLIVAVNIQCHVARHKKVVQ